LEDAGCRVTVPKPSLCCGRPLYDYGFLPMAKRLLRQILNVLRPEIEAGTPIVGLEPSCVAVFRDELVQMFPMDEDAKRLNEQVHTLAEFLEQKLDGYQPPKLQREAIVHGHCHHKAVIHMGPEDRLYKKMGLLFEMPDTGCCGMAGSFGFEAPHYEVSTKVGEHKLIPLVREASKDTLIIADGFSCKHQIQEMIDRRALHLAQVLQMGLRESPSGPPGGYPEAYQPDVRLEVGRSRALARSAATVGLGALLVGGAAYALTRKDH